MGCLRPGETQPQLSSRRTHSPQITSPAAQVSEPRRTGHPTNHHRHCRTYSSFPPLPRLSQVCRLLCPSIVFSLPILCISCPNHPLPNTATPTAGSRIQLPVRSHLLSEGFIPHRGVYPSPNPLHSPVLSPAISLELFPHHPWLNTPPPGSPQALVYFHRTGLTRQRRHLPIFSAKVLKEH